MTFFLFQCPNPILPICTYMRARPHTQIPPHPLTHAHIHCSHMTDTRSHMTDTLAMHTNTRYQVQHTFLHNHTHTPGTHTHSHRHTYTLHATTQAHTDAHHPHTTCIHRMHIYILTHIQHTQQVSTEHPTRHWGYSDEQNRPNFFPTRSLYQEWREKGIWRKYEARIGRKRAMLPLVAEPAAAAVTSED